MRELFLKGLDAVCSIECEYRCPLILYFFVEFDLAVEFDNSDVTLIGLGLSDEELVAVL